MRMSPIMLAQTILLVPNTLPMSRPAASSAASVVMPEMKTVKRRYFFMDCPMRWDDVIIMYVILMSVKRRRRIFFFSNDDLNWKDKILRFAHIITILAPARKCRCVLRENDIFVMESYVHLKALS